MISSDDIETEEDEQRSDYQWCMHCERAYKRGEHRMVGDVSMCPYPGCNGDTFMDGWDWDQFREPLPQYPAIPEFGVKYPMYPSKEDKAAIPATPDSKSAKRAFRTEESYEEESVTRGMILPFLKQRGFTSLTDERKTHGKTESQRVRGLDSAGRSMTMRIKLCWRLGREGKAHTYSAAQLVAKARDNQWQQVLERFVENSVQDGVTHLLIVQRDGQEIVDAACIPMAAVVPIWLKQRDESNRLIAAGAMGRRKKNHAVNGGSPTLWLRDDVAPSVPAVLWNHPSVVNLADSPVVPEFEPPTFAEIRMEARSYVEGSAVQVTREVKARCDALRNRAREHFRDSNGLLRCRVCGWHKPADPRISGEIVELHHLDPISEAPDEGRTVTTEEALTLFVPVCPTCHRLTHAKLGGGQFDEETLRGILKDSPPI